MRKIEKQMIEALRNGRTFIGSNTVIDAGINVYLFGNRIAYVDPSTKKLTIDIPTFEKWPTATTKSRLRALGLDFQPILEAMKAKKMEQPTLL